MPSAQRPTPPVLSDGVVTLRPLGPDDIDDITLGCQDPSIQRWTTVPVPYERSDAEKFVARRAAPSTWWETPTWAITTVPSNRWSGTIDLRLDGHSGAEIGYLLAPGSRGSGHATRAIRLACAWGFSSLNLQVVAWYALVGNTSSRRAAREAGFRISTQVLRRHLPDRGQRGDAWVGDLLPEDLTAAARQADGRERYLGPALTRRELTVLEHLARGQSNRVIAAALGISENTVKNHVRSILEKLQATSRSEAVVIALREGLTSIPR